MLKLETMIYELPEDVLKRKWSGDFEGEIALIDALLKKDIPEMMKERLKIERRMAKLLPKEFCISRKEALEMLNERIADFDESELDALELDRAVEYIYIRGEKYYLHSFLDTLIKVHPEYAARAGVPDQSQRPKLDEAIAEMKEKGELAYRFRIRGTLKIKDTEYVPGGSARVHMPVPQRCAQQSEIEIMPCSGKISDERSAQRTVYFERLMGENAPFEVEYSYVNRVKYVDPLDGKGTKAIAYPDAAAPTAEDLSERLPHIRFTPYLRELAREIAGEEKDPVRIAWKFYEYVTTKVRYSYMRSYFLIENQAEYCAVNGKGDCGIQAILFITLCRISGIPARWQSGLAVDEHSCGCHDWAQFYAEPYGWMFCDPSFGGSAWRAGATERWKFYFGNLDPFRMVANSDYQRDFDPPKLCDRADPYDNQQGEVELNGVGLIESRIETEYKTLEYTKIT